MFTKNDVLESIGHEFKVIKHLIGKLDETHLEYRPTSGQRSTLELLQYLACAGLVTAQFVQTKNWEHNEALMAEATQLKLTDFAASMDTQMEAITALFKDWDEAKFKNTPAQLPWGEEVNAGTALVNMTLKMVTAYRMQLFLYMRSMNIANIGTADCWAGVDQAAPEAKSNQA